MPFIRKLTTQITKFFFYILAKTMCNAEILVTKSFERRSGKSESRPFLKSVETTQKRVSYELSGILKTEFIWLFLLRILIQISRKSH